MTKYIFYRKRHGSPRVLLGEMVGITEEQANDICAAIKDFGDVEVAYYTLALMEPADAYH
jgi:hypothetical protein